MNWDKLNELLYDKDTNQIDYRKIIDFLEYSYEGIVLADHESRIIYANRALERISGAPLQEIIGTTPAELIEKGLIIDQSIEVFKKQPLTMTQKLITGREVFITSQLVEDEDGRPLCYIANYRDLNEINGLYKDSQRQKDIDYTELQELRSRLLNTDSFISRNVEMQQILERVIKVAKVDVVVLIRGESGTGKEVIAKTIHKMSHRADKPYIQINCAAIPESLLEAELFGYEKGAFTGADKNKIGLLEVANGGTILFDEIGDLPTHLQVKLLRVIQTKEFYPVGSLRPKVVDIRFLAATHRDLEEMVAKGTFRQDLFYRLDVVPISLPPLRKRKEDIIPLTHYFLEKFNRKYGTQKKFDVSTIQAMENYEWPGNVRQLENTVERMVIMAERDNIDAYLLPDEVQSESSHTEIPKGSERKITLMPLQKAKELLEKDMITQALQINKSIRKAARTLEVDHSTLVRKIQKHKIRM